MDFDAEKTPGEERFCRPLAVSEVRPFDLTNPTAASTTLPLSHSVTSSAQGSLPVLLSGHPATLPASLTLAHPSGSSFYPASNSPIYQTDPIPQSHHGIYPVTQLPTIHPAHPITVQVSVQCASSF